MAQQGICLQQLRNQYNRFEIKPPIVFSVLASNVAYLLSKGIQTNVILEASHESFILHCSKVHQGVLETRIVKCFIANSYLQLSSAVELFQFQKDAQDISPTFEGYEEFILNSQDEIMNFIRKSFFRNSIDHLYRLNSSTGLFDHFDMIRKWILDLLESVCLLHERGLAHGGIKASNIFVNQDTNKIYLTDFGFGRKNEVIHRKLRERVLTVPPEKPENLACLQFKDVYSLMVLIYQMTFGFDCSQQIIQSLQFGAPFDETEQGDNPNDNEESEFKYLVVKLMNRVVCGREANSIGQSIFYVSDILHLRRGIDSPKNSPRNIEKILLQTLGFDKATNGQMQSSFGADNSPQVVDSINRKEKQAFEEEKQNEEAFKPNLKQSATHRGSKSMLLTIQEQVDIYKKSDFARYQEHSESNKKSNSSSEKIKSCNIIGDQPQMSELNRIDDIIQVFNPQLDLKAQIHQEPNQEIIVIVASEDQNSSSKELNALNRRKIQSMDSRDQQNQRIPATDRQQTESDFENTQCDFNTSSLVNQQKDYVLCFQNSDQKVENDKSNEFSHDRQVTDHQQDNNKYEDCWEFDFAHKLDVQKGDDIRKQDYAEIEKIQIKNADQQTQARAEKDTFINLTGAQLQQFNQSKKDQNQSSNQIEEIIPIKMKIPIQNQFQEGGNVIPQTGQRQVDLPVQQFEEAAMQNYEILKAPNGTIIYQGQVIEGQKQGLGVLFNDQGQKIYEGQFLNDQYHGKGKEFYENGQILHDGDYQEGYLYGFARSFNKDGSLNYEGTYKNGLCDGEGAKFNSQNVLISIGQYEKGKLNGQLRRYFEDGKIEFEGSFKNNRREGQSVEYYRNGQVQCSILYRKGRKIEGQEFNQSGEITFNGQYPDDDVDIC